MDGDRLVDALLSGFGCLDQLESRAGPLGLDLDAREPGPFWSPLSWPRDAGPGLSAGHGEPPLLELVASLDLRFSSDPYHYSPGSFADRLGSRPIASYVALVKAPRSVLEPRLAAKLGPPHVTTRRDASGLPVTCHAYGDVWRFFLRDAPNGCFWLEYTAQTPAYAVADREPAVLHELLRSLPSTLAGLSTPEDWKAFADRLPQAAGVRASCFSPEGAPKGMCSFLDLELEPPFDATVLAELWGLPEPFAVSTDVHMSRWYLAVPVEQQLSSGESYRTFSPPVLGGYRVEASLVGWPKPAPGYDGVRFGPSTAYDLRRAEARVRIVSFWLPRS